MSIRLGAGSYVKSPSIRAIRDYNSSSKKEKYGKTVRGANATAITNRFGNVNYEAYRMNSPKSMLRAVIVVIIVVLIIILIGYVFHLIKTGSKTDPSYFEKFQTYGGVESDDEDAEDDDYDFAEFDDLIKENPNASSIKMTSIHTSSLNLAPLTASNTSNTSTYSTPSTTLKMRSASSSPVDMNEEADSTTSSIPQPNSSLTTIPEAPLVPSVTTTNNASEFTDYSSNTKPEFVDINNLKIEGFEELKQMSHNLI